MNKVSKISIQVLSISILAIFGFCGIASAQDLYVSPGGSGEQCTSASPCSLDYAIDNAVPGFSVYLDAGNYGDVVFDSSSSFGDTNNWITYSSWPGRVAPHVDSLEMPSVDTDSYLKFYDINFDPGYLLTTKNTVDLAEANYVSFDNCYFESAKVLRASGDFAPYCFSNSATIYTHHQDSSSHITISNSTFKYGYNGIRIVSDYQTDWVISGNTMLEIADNTIQIGGAKNILISDNKIHSGNKYRFLAYWPGTATGDWSERQYETITQDTTNASGKFYQINDSSGYFELIADDENNKPIRSNQYVWRLDSDPTQVYWTPSGNGDDAHTDFISIEGLAEDIVIEKNLFYETTGNGIKIGSTGGEPSNITIKNNIIYSEGGCLFFLAAGNNIQIYNNIMERGGGKPVWAMRTLSGGPELYLRNNIISGVIHGAGTVTASNNIWQIPESQLDDAFEEGNSFYDVDYDSLFEDRANRDYRLVFDSLAIDAGYYMDTIVTTDYIDTLRPQDGDDSSTAEHDIGAYEYFQGPSSTVIRANVNQDSNINSSDALLILRKALNRSMTSTDWQSSATTGDVNCDGSVNTVDALLSLRYSLGMNMSGSGWCE